ARLLGHLARPAPAVRCAAPRDEHAAVAQLGERRFLQAATRNLDRNFNAFARFPHVLALLRIPAAVEAEAAVSPAAVFIVGIVRRIRASKSMYKAAVTQTDDVVAEVAAVSREECGVERLARVEVGARFILELPWLGPRPT